MKANLIDRNLFKPFVVVILLFALSNHLNAQCPTVTNPTPLICDAAGFTVQDLDTFATDTNNDIQWYDSETGGSILNPNELVTEGVYYAGNSSGNCGTRPSVTVDFVVDPSNQNLDAVYCSNESPTIQLYINDALSVAIPSGGSVEVYTDQELTNQANPTDAIPTGGTNYFIVFVDSGGCRSQIELGNTATFDAPNDPTPPLVQAFCSNTNPTVADLVPGTADTFNWYESLNGSGDPVQPELQNTDTLANGTYYIQAESFFCTSDPVAVTVEINMPVDPGSSADLEFCSDSLPASDINLIDELGGTPDTNGTWTGPLPISNGSTGTINISGQSPGVLVFTYTIPSNSACPDGTSTVTITIYETFSSGTPSANNPASFCVSESPGAFDLFTLLDNEDPGGQWTEGTTSSGTVTTSTIDFSGFTPGTYDYTYTQNLAPNLCPEESTTVQVIIVEDPNAGVAVNASFCENETTANSPFDLFTALDGSQDNNGGIWTDANGVVVNSPIDISTFTVAGSPYEFTYTISNGTCDDSETITITIEPAPESGNALAPLEICFETLAANSPLDLFTLLDGTQDNNGTWYEGTDTSGAVVTNPVDISGLTAGTYNYTYSVPDIGSCSDVDVTVELIVLPQPNSGTPTNATFCENDIAGNSPLDLFGQLSGNEAGGTWTDDDGSGALSGSDVDLTILPIGSYNYTYSLTSSDGCTNSSTVTVTIEEAPESGNALAPLEICFETLAANSPLDLFTLLDGTQDNNGTWYEGIDTSGAVVANPVDISGLTAGTYNYTYSVPDIGSCSDVDVTVELIVLPQPNTGTPTNATFCENDVAGNSPLDLFGQLSGNEAGGTWTDDDGSGALSGSDVDLTVLPIGSYNYTYSLTSSAGCTNSSTVTVTIEEAPESGNALAPLEICFETLAANSPLDLFTLLDGTQDNNGTWYEGADTSGTVVANPVDISGLTAGTYNYTYSVPDIGSCSDVDVTVELIVLPQPNSGTPTNATFCENDVAGNSPLDLFGQLSGNEAGGTWTDDDGSGALSGSDVDLTVLPIGSYNYTYSLTSSDGCTNSSTVTVTIEEAPESGTANAPQEFCLLDISTGQTYNLFDLLTGEDQPGVWNDDDASGALNGNIVSLDVLAAGIYNFTYDVNAIGICDDELVTVSLIINDTPAPTAPSPQEFCDSAIVGDLVANGTNIQWYDEPIAGNLLDASIALVDGETYYATQTNSTSGCESSIRLEVVVNIFETPNSGNVLNPGIVACNDDSSIDLFSGLDGTQDSGGTWQDDSGTGALTDNILDATGLTAGNYQFTYVVTGSSPCVDQSTTITITIEEPLNPGTDTDTNVCLDSGTIDLFTLLVGADVGGTWSPALSSGTGVFDPTIDAPGAYIYELSNTCGTFTSTVNVSVTQPADAGGDSTAEICAIDDTFDLTTLLTGTPDANGTWSPALNSGSNIYDPLIDGSGVYTYTVAATSPCTADASAQVTITVNDTQEPTVVDATPVYCAVDNPSVFDLDAVVNATGTINWYADNTLSTVLDPTETLIDGEDYFATQTGSTGCESSTSISVSVTINDAPTPSIIDTDLDYCVNDDPTFETLSENILENGQMPYTVIWYNTPTDGIALDTSDELVNGETYYAALLDADTGCESSVRLEVTPDLTNCGTLVIPDGFSPNGDGINDTFNIDNLEVLHPNFEIEIYNRYGNLVYKGNEASARFDGTSNQSTIGDKVLPVGVYFYIFNFNDGENKPVQGRLYLSR